MTTPLPPGDYISPQLERVSLDFAFPNMTVGDPACNPWPYLRKDVPHNWYVDRRVPWMGFLNRDEAHLAYNNALPFRGQRALEIGCWMGWSAAHFVAAGVNLDVVDPALCEPFVRESVIHSLTEVGHKFNSTSQVKLHASTSPHGVEQLAAQGTRWSLIFIDGEHEGQGPLQDAEVVARYAEPDALVLFHDLEAPAVGAGLDYFRDAGWHTMVYQTMQIMGVAWRGKVRPVDHQPDPSIAWRLPTHLKGYAVSGQLTP